MPHLNKLQKKYSSKGFTVIAVTNEELELIQRYSVHETPMNYPVFIKASTRGYKGRGIPRGYLIDAEGKVSWSGNPNSLSDKKIDKLLRDRGRFISKTYKGAPSSAIRSMIRGQYMKAYQTALPQQEKKEGAKKMVEFLAPKVQREVDFANALFQSGDYFAAYNAYSKIKKALKKGEFAELAKEKMKECKSRDNKKEYDAFKKLARMTAKSIKKRADRKKLARVLEAFAKSKKYRDLKAAEKAKALAVIYAKPWQ